MRDVHIPFDEIAGFAAEIVALVESQPVIVVGDGLIFFQNGLAMSVEDNGDFVVAEVLGVRNFALAEDAVFVAVDFIVLER